MGTHLGLGQNPTPRPCTLDNPSQYMLAVLDLQGSRSDNMALSPTSLRNRAAKEHKRAKTPEDMAAAQDRLRGMARQQGVYHRKVRLCLNGLLSEAREGGADAGGGADGVVWERGIRACHVEQHEQATGKLW